MKTYTFEPSDLLFIRDARPIDIGGHGARWPDSPLIFDAIHAALHRAFPTPQPWEHAHCEGVSAGFFAALPTKQNGGPPLECIDHLFASDSAILIGGQLRSCTVKATTDPAIGLLPIGTTITGKCLKWILLTPAIFPAIEAHPGGWLPSWIDATNGRVQLLDGPGKNKAARMKQSPGKPIGARLVAACVPRAVALSGWSERIEAAKDNGHKDNCGPRATMLAVPAGSVYYFEADSPEEAQKLASALNWHASLNFHRRSTLLGEKGLGLGICAPW